MFCSVEVAEDGQRYPCLARYCDTSSASSWKPWASILPTVFYIRCTWCWAVWQAWWVYCNIRNKQIQSTIGTEIYLGLWWILIIIRNHVNIICIYTLCIDTIGIHPALLQHLWCDLGKRMCASVQPAVNGYLLSHNCNVKENSLGPNRQLALYAP